MDVFIILLNKCFTLLFVLSGLNFIRHSYMFIQHLLLKEQYIIEKKSLFLLGMSIAYIISSLFIGITI